MDEELGIIGEEIEPMIGLEERLDGDSGLA
jgi:hypothetical protein